MNAWTVGLGIAGGTGLLIGLCWLIWLNGYWTGQRDEARRQIRIVNNLRQRHEGHGW